MVDKPSSFHLRIEEHSQIIKEKQAEAERLKTLLEQTNKVHFKSKKIDNYIASNKSRLARGKIRLILAKKSEVKTAMIVGEILHQPLALRR